MAYENFKDLARRTVFDKILHDKAFSIAKTRKYDGYQRGIALMVHKFFDKIPSAMRAWSEILAMYNEFAEGTVKNEIVSNKKLAEELHKTMISKFKKRKVYSLL